MMRLSKVADFLRPATLILVIGAVLLIGAGSAVWARPVRPDRPPPRGGTVPRREADLAISMSGAKKGTAVTFKIRIKNNGQVISENVVVTGGLPSNLKYASMQGKCQVDNGALKCTLGNLSAGADTNLTITGYLDPKARSKPMTASSSVAAHTRDPNNSNNKAKVVIP